MQRFIDKVWVDDARVYAKTRDGLVASYPFAMWEHLIAKSGNKWSPAQKERAEIHQRFCRITQLKNQGLQGSATRRSGLPVLHVQALHGPWLAQLLATEIWK